MLARSAGSNGWSLTDHLLAMVLDELRLANWQRVGKKGLKRPKPLSPLANQGVRHGRTDRSPEEVARVLERYGPARSNGEEVTHG